MKTPLKILHLWNVYQPGLFDETHPYCLREKIPSSILASRFPDNGTELLPHTRVLRKDSARRATNPTLFERARNRFENPLLEKRFNQEALRMTEEWQPSLLHFHYGTTASELLPFLRKNREIPSVVSFYGVDASASLQDPKTVKKYKEFFSYINLALVLCESVAERLRGVGCPPEKIRVWNLPIPLDNYPYYERTPAETIRFLSCARFVEKKGHLYLIDAFRKLLDHGKKARLTLIGYGPLENEIRRQIETKNLKNHVDVINTSKRPDFTTLYRKALEEHDIFVLPSTVAASGDDEGGPALTLVSAQHSGMPVICTPFPGSEISVQDEVSGIFCESNNAEDLFKKMNTLSSHPEKWHTFGKNAHEKSKTEFSWEGQLQKLTKHYQSLIL